MYCDDLALATHKRPWGFILDDVDSYCFIFFHFYVRWGGGHGDFPVELLKTLIYIWY